MKPRLGCVDALPFLEIMILFRKEILEVMPYFLIQELLTPNFDGVYIYYRSQYRVVGIGYDLSRCVWLLDINLILDAVINDKKYFSTDMVVSNALSNIFWFSLRFVSIIFS